ncbi:MAG: class I SAM-dependent methyltransferase [Desulfobacteraceae bacterium]|nr:MAG: class I SAM-dependent methyltransferase [Desulfobacteraceae bacterium]
MAGHFKDHFSRQSKTYAEFRPNYPTALFEWIFSFIDTADRAWDCATGNGQSALALSGTFSRIYATDASPDQIKQAAPAANIMYRVARAEDSGIPDASIDLITVSQAIHWFDVDAFFLEADRVLKPGGMLAVWCYGLFSLSSPADRIIQNLYHNTLAGSWPPERDHVDNGYADIQFPWPLIPSPQFEIEKMWGAQQLIGFLNSWSAVQRFIKTHSFNPVEHIATALRDVVRDKIPVIWPVTLKLAQKPK